MQIFFRRRMLPAASLVALAGLFGCDAAGGQATVETDDQKVSYAIGVNVGSNLSNVSERIDVDALRRGLMDALSGDSTLMTDAEMQGLLQGFAAEMQQAAATAASAAADENLAASTAFMAGNREREGVITTESGLQYEVVEAADGPTPSPDDRVEIHYRGTLADGTQFDSSYDRGEPITLGVDGFISGFSEGLQLMSVGSKYKFYIPPELGYGAQDGGTIPPNSALVFEVELLGIE